MVVGFYDFILGNRDNEKWFLIIQMIEADKILPKTAQSGDIYLYLLKSAKYRLYKDELQGLFRLYIAALMDIK